MSARWGTTQQQQPSVASPAEGQLSSDGSMQGATLGRTGLFDARGPEQPQRLVWATGRLFATKEVTQVVGEAGPIRLAVDLPTGHHYTAPVLSRGALYFTAYVGSGYLFALDAATGRERWRFKSDRTALTSPAVAGDLAFVVASDGSVFAVETATGRPRWNAKLKGGGFTVSSPLVAGGVLYFCSTETSGLNPHMSDGRLHAFDAQAGRELWSYKAKGSLAAPALAGDVVYFGGSKGHLYAVERATGRELWKFDAGGGVVAPVVAGGAVFFGTEGGDLYCVDAATGQRKWKAAKTGRANTLLAVAGGLVYFGGKGDGLYAIDAATGQERWRLKTPAPPRTPVVAGATVYFPLGDALCAADAATGQPKWAYKNKSALRLPPVVADGRLYYLDDSGNAFALE